MRTISISEAKTNLSALAHDVSRTGQPVLLIRYSEPIAKLTPVTDDDITDNVLHAIIRDARALTTKLFTDGDLTSDAAQILNGILDRAWYPTMSQDDTAEDLRDTTGTGDWIM